jgi:hypothetical protein
MAKTDTPENATSKIEIDFYTPGPKYGPYDAHVLKLIEQDKTRTQEMIDNGTHASVKITVPNVIEEAGKDGETKSFDGVERHKRYFQESARARKVTAREITDAREVGATETIMRFVVIEEVKRPRKQAEDTANVPEKETSEKETVTA